jgi:hypothetical protein
MTVRACYHENLTMDQIDPQFSIYASRKTLAALKRKIEREVPGRFSFELRERQGSVRGGLAQHEILQLLVTAAVGGAAKSAVDAVIAALKDGKAKGLLWWRRKSRKRSRVAAKNPAQKPAPNPIKTKPRKTRKQS